MKLGSLVDQNVIRSTVLNPGNVRFCLASSFVHLPTESRASAHHNVSHEGIYYNAVSYIDLPIRYMVLFLQQIGMTIIWL